MVHPNPLLLRDDAEAAPVAPAVGPAVDPQVGIPGHTNTIHGTGEQSTWRTVCRTVDRSKPALLRAAPREPRPGHRGGVQQSLCCISPRRAAETSSHTQNRET